MNALALIKAGTTARKAFRRWRDKKRIEKGEEPKGESQMFKGKLTYTAIIAIAAPIISSALGFDVVPADLEPIYVGVVSSIGLFGRWRATRGTK